LDLQECDSKSDPRLPRNACALYRQMMHTHFADCGMIFGRRIWCDFGLCDMVHDGNFMRDMLLDMFKAYFLHRQSEQSALPPIFDAVSKQPDQRICAFCLSTRLGTGQMSRCPCTQVYYCSAACQGADWKVHKLVCGARKGRQPA
jgi:hypothetical protein